MKNFIIKEDDAGRRLDRILRRLLKKTSTKSATDKTSTGNCVLSTIYAAIRKGQIRLNGKKVKPSCLTKVNDVLSIGDVFFKNALENASSKEFSIGDDIVKEKIKDCQEKAVQAQHANCFDKGGFFSVLLKTEHLLFINKELGIATHGTNSIDEIIKAKFKVKDSLSFSVAALHRLDKNTTGILTFSQSLQGAQWFSKAIREGLIDRYYLGLNEGKIKSGHWQIPYEKSHHCSNTGSNTEKKMQEKIKKEITETRLIEYNKDKNISLVLYKLITGKKHQIRRVATHFGVPLFCDRKYGSRRYEYSAYFLHAFALGFKKRVDFLPKIIIAPMPERFIAIIKRIFPKCKRNLEKIGEELFLKEMLS